MAEIVQAWRSVDGTLFTTEAEAIRHNEIEAAAAVIVPPVEGRYFDADLIYRRAITKAAIDDLYDKCGWRRVL